MTRYLHLLLFCVCAVSAVQAQQLNPSIIASDGGSSKAAGISLEWTLGEPMIESLSAADKLYTQGFHQPYLLVKKIPVKEDDKLKDPKQITGSTAAQKNLTAAEKKQPVSKQFSPSAKVPENMVTVSPNPVRSVLSVNFSSQIPVGSLFILTDMSGKRIQTITNTAKGNTQQLNMQGMKPGMYILEIRNAEGKLIHNFKITRLR